MKDRCSLHRTTRSLLAGLVAVGALTVTAAPAASQDQDDPVRSRFSASLGVLNLQPLGNLVTGPGWGADLSVAWALDPAQRIRLRADFRGGIYGRDTRTVCLSQTIGCLIEVDVNTDYTNFYLGVGPELAIPLGGPILVLDATAGFGGFSVTSSVEGTSDTQNQDLFRTENFSEGHFSYSAGGQLRIPISDQVRIALGVHYQYSGTATYVPPGGVTLNGDGSVNVAEVTSDANQVAFTLGFAFHPFEGWTEELEDDDG